jgi:hypothetical protein
MRGRFDIAILFCLLPISVFLLPGPSAAAQGTPAPAGGGTAVVCDPQDAFYPLAGEISKAESFPIYPAIEPALTSSPRFLLWIGSPAFFTDRILAQSGLAQKRLASVASIGIITGRNLEEARSLWQRRGSVAGARVYAVNGEYPPARVTIGRITSSTGVFAGNRALAKPELVEALKNADYLTFTGHGGGTYWHLAEGVSFQASDFPRMPPVILAAASCQAVRLNLPNSLALAALSNGAAAFAGYLFSPVEGYLIGEFNGLPMRYTWPGATIGEVVQLQNRGAMQGISAFPYYLLLGDPRIQLQPEASWSPLGIESFRGARTLNFGETPPGLFPLRLKNGAQYRYLEIPGVTAAADEDVFYNSRLQMINQGPDKLVLVSHTGGELKISLRAEPPRFRRFTDPLLDSLDQTLVYLPGTGGTWITLLLAGLALYGVISRLRRPGRSRRVMLRCMLAGVAMALGQTLYVLYRIDLVTITSKPVGIGALEVVATALLASYGMILFLQAGSASGKAMGVMAAVIQGALAIAVSFGFILVMNIFSARNAGAGIYNFHMTWLALIGTTCQAVFFGALASVLSIKARASAAVLPQRR